MIWKFFLTHNEEKLAERFIRISKNKICKLMTSISKNVYVDELDDTVDKYSNTYHTTFKMKPVDAKSKHILTLVKISLIKILNLKLVILLEYQNKKIFLQKVTLQIGLKKFL